ncbi:hypothetical protein HOY80DRAFT_969769 [Tuber brumale]|nr:hypothetical protein HOY80DRAFT_969769 [Tuber brumale]
MVSLAFISFLLLPICDTLCPPSIDHRIDWNRGCIGPVVLRKLLFGGSVGSALIGLSVWYSTGIVGRCYFRSVLQYENS